MTGRLLGIDYGTKRIGLAISDGLGIGARELEILLCESLEADFDRIAEVAQRESAVGIVVGIPYSPNAPAGIKTQAQLVRAWGKQLAAALQLPMAEVSEYLSSEEARQMARVRKRDPHAPLDDLAARIILQAYLDARSHRPT